MNICKKCNRPECIAQLCLVLGEITEQDFYNISHNKDNDLILVKYMLESITKRTKKIHDYLKKEGLLSEKLDQEYKELNIETN